MFKATVQAVAEPGLLISALSIGPFCFPVSIALGIKTSHRLHSGLCEIYWRGLSQAGGRYLKNKTPLQLALIWSLYWPV